MQSKFKEIHTPSNACVYVRSLYKDTIWSILEPIASFPKHQGKMCAKARHRAEINVNSADKYKLASGTVATEKYCPTGT